MFKSVRAKILLLQITMAVFVCVALGISSYYLMTFSLKKSQQTNLSFIAKSQADKLVILLSHRRYLFKHLALEDAVKKYAVSYSGVVLTELFAKFKAEFPILSFVNEDGTESLKLVNGVEVDTHSDVSRSKIFKAVNQKRKEVLTTISYTPDNPAAAVMEFGIYRQNFFDEFEGVIIGRVPLAEVFNDIKRFTYGQTGFLILLDSRGTILAHSNDEKIFLKLDESAKPFPKTLANALAMEFGTGRLTIPGLDAFVAYAPVKDRDWTVLAVLPYQEFMAAPNGLKRFAIIISFIILIISVSITIAIANGIAAPVRKLTQSARMIAKGDLSQKVDIRTSSEIGTLGRAFNQMTANLQKSQIKLQESEKKLAITLRSIGDAVIVTDNNGKVVMMNPVAEQITGWTEAAAAGKEAGEVFKIVNEKTGQKVENPVTKVLKENVVVGLANHTILIAKDGTRIAIDDSGAPIVDDNGQIIGVVLVFRDVTEKRKAAEALQRSHLELEKRVAERTAELAQANKSLSLEMEEKQRAEEKRAQLEAQLQRAEKMEAIGTLAGGVAHDLNNVLSGIVTYPELILLDLPEDSPLRELVINIQESGLKAAAIVEDLLTMARRGVVISKVLNLNDIVVKYLASPEHEKLLSFHEEVEIESDLAEDILNICGSPVHLSKTVMNLVSNSAEAMPKGGKIVIATENIYVDRPIKGYDSVAKGDYVKLTVSDTGEGIAPQDIKRIFEPFYTKKIMGRSGTGLGMAVVYGVVKDHNGYIDVQSSDGQGTVVTLYYPATRELLAETKKPVSIDDYRGTGESILVVDDAAQQRDLAKHMLTTLGYSVHVVSSGEVAIEYLKKQPVDLVLLDMIMDPGIDGLDTYRRIIEIQPNQATIIASGFSETERVKMAQKLGAGQYIKKPYTLEKLGIAIKQQLSSFPKQ